MNFREGDKVINIMDKAGRVGIIKRATASRVEVYDGVNTEVNLRYTVVVEVDGRLVEQRNVPAELLRQAPDQ
jgi:hypothetical protein